MNKARDFINEALEILGVISAGETASSADIATGLRSLNAMLGSWSADGMLVFSATREVFPLVPGQATYTMGPEGDFDTSRPIEILRAGLNYQTDVDVAEFKLDVVNLDEWASITTKNIQSSIPTTLYAETTMPGLTISLWPVPTEPKELVLYSNKPFATLASVNDELLVPPGYSMAIPYNLAEAMAPKFGRELNGAALKTAQKSLAAIQVRNLKPLLMTPDSIGVDCSDFMNILTGGPRAF